jgi:hypothetical protein
MSLHKEYSRTFLFKDGGLSADCLTQMIATAERMHADDIRRDERYVARNALEQYVLSMQCDGVDEGAREKISKEVRSF